MIQRCLQIFHKIDYNWYDIICNEQCNMVSKFFSNVIINELASLQAMGFFFIIIYFWYSVIIIIFLILDKFVLKIQINKKVLYFIDILNGVENIFLLGHPQVCWVILKFFLLSILFIRGFSSLNWTFMWFRNTSKLYV